VTEFHEIKMTKFTTADPNPHETNFDKSEFVTRSNWNSRILGLSDSLWGFAITATNQNVFKALIESVWIAAWDRAPLRWVRDSGYGYGTWNSVLGWCNGTPAAYLPITEDQARSLYPDDESFNEDWGWRDDDTDGTVD
jgi:hypothetical protein